MFCINCGAQLDDKYGFCPACGAKVNIPNQPLKTEMPEAPEIPQADAAPAAAGPSPIVGDEPLTTPLFIDPIKAKEPDDAPEPKRGGAPVPTPESFVREQDDEVTQLLKELESPEGDEVTTKFDDEPLTTPLFHDPFPGKSAEADEVTTVLPPKSPDHFYVPKAPQYEPEKPSYDAQPWMNNGYGSMNRPGNMPYGEPAPAAPVQPQKPVQPKPQKPPKPPKQKKVYRKTSAGVKVLSIVMCLLVFLFGTLAVLTAGLRVGLTESNVRSVCRDGSLADLVIYTDKGEKLLVDVIVDGAVDEQTAKVANIERAKIRQFLEKSSISMFIEDLAVDYQRFLFDNTTPTKLNADAIGDFLANLSYDLKHETGYELTPEYISEVKDSINDGGLSFLSIDAGGGGFKKHYHIDPQLISVAFSLWVMIICIAVVLLFIVLIFVVNAKNPPAGLSFNGVTLVIVGGLYTLMSLAILILSAVKKLYLISGLLKYIAFGTGTVGVIILVLGVIMLVIKGILKRRSVTE